MPNIQITQFIRVQLITHEQYQTAS
jgi:hypothetical protein